MDFLIIVCILCSDYNASDGDDLFADYGRNNSKSDFIPEQSAYEGEDTYDLIDNQEAYNASGNWSLYDNVSDHFVNIESHSDTEMEEGNFKLHTFYTNL